MVISKGVKKGQATMLIIILLIFMLLLIGGFIANNANYIYIILLGCLLFGPIYLYNLKFYDIYMRNDFFIISNLIRKRKISESEFIGVIPAKKVLFTLNSPYFTILFKDGSAFNFVKERPLKQVLHKDRKLISEELTRAISESIKASNKNE